MDTQIVAVFCPYAEILQALHRLQDPQYRMTDVEVMTTAITAAMFFRGNFEHTRKYLLDEGYIPGVLSKGRFSRRLHRIQDLVVHKRPTTGTNFVIDPPKYVLKTKARRLSLCTFDVRIQQVELG